MNDAWNSFPVSLVLVVGAIVSVLMVVVVVGEKKFGLRGPQPGEMKSLQVKVCTAHARVIEYSHASLKSYPYPIRHRKF